MILKKALSLVFPVVALGVLAVGGKHIYAAKAATIQPLPLAKIAPKIDARIRPNLAGSYLASHYAQSQNDWAHATPIMKKLLAQDPDNTLLLRQAMILAEESGDHDSAASYAKRLMAQAPDSGLANLIVAAHALAGGHDQAAIAALDTLPKGDMAGFVLPLLKGWALAGEGKFDAEMFKGTTIHAYHGGLIAHFLKKDSSVVFNFAETILAPSGLTAGEVERAADLMAISGHQKDALNVYKALVAQNGGSDDITQKITALEKGGDLKGLIPALAVKTPAQGAATALLDIAQILFQEKNDASARLFAQMALDLDPKRDDAHILIASSYARDNRFDQAIAQYDKVSEKDPAFLDTRHEAAALLAESGRMDQAVALLQKLYATHHDPDSLIRIGDLYRSQRDFGKALEVYDAVATKLPSPVPAKYWYLLYARGMTEERQGDWPKAEADLKAALAYQPNHPYILNYLGYAWVDKGVHLDKALKMLKKAVSLRPTDGYIVDSLGWAYYKLKDYKNAVALLEQAVELLPYDPEINGHLGDAYWTVGRHVEARFQWQRARNFTKDTKLAASLDRKLAEGLPAGAMKQAAGDVPGEALSTNP